MFVPMPLLIIALVLFAIMGVLVLRGKRGSRDLIAPPSSPMRPPRSQPGPSNAFVPQGGLTERAAQMKADGRLIEAIKMVREETGLGLREAKDLVDSL